MLFEAGNSPQTRLMVLGHQTNLRENEWICARALIEHRFASPHRQAWRLTGFYVYLGSARDPGGLGTRFGHHPKPTSRPHWHIDYLRAHADPEGVWYCYDSRPWGHQWAKWHRGGARTSIPLLRFGASDCGCETHLFFFRGRPLQTSFARSLRAFDRSHPPVRLYSPAGSP